MDFIVILLGVFGGACVGYLVATIDADRRVRQLQYDHHFALAAKSLEPDVAEMFSTGPADSINKNAGEFSHLVGEPLDIHPDQTKFDFANHGAQEEKQNG